MGISYRTAKFKSTNTFAMAIWGSTAKFNSHQYFRLYSNQIYIKYLLTLGACMRITDLMVIIFVCLWVCVCYQASCYIPHLCIESQVPLGFQCWLQHEYWLDFVSYGNICWPPLPSSFLDQLSMDKRDSDGFFSRRLVCRNSNSSYYSSLVTIDYQQHFMACNFLCV